MSSPGGKLWRVQACNSVLCIFPWHNTTELTYWTAELTCWSHCCSSSVSSSKCITASTYGNQQKNVRLSAVQNFKSLQRNRINLLQNHMHQQKKVSMKDEYAKYLINWTPHSILINHPRCYLLSLTVSKYWYLGSNSENSKTYTWIWVRVHMTWTSVPRHSVQST